MGLSLAKLSSNWNWYLVYLSLKVFFCICILAYMHGCLLTCMCTCLPTYMLICLLFHRLIYLLGYLFICFLVSLFICQESLWEVLPEVDEKGCQRQMTRSSRVPFQSHNSFTAWNMNSSGEKITVKKSGHIFSYSKRNLFPPQKLPLS